MALYAKARQTGSIWRNPNSPFSRRNVSTAASPYKQILIRQVAAWEADRNAHHAKVDWQFTTDDARIKLKRLYPTL